MVAGLMPGLFSQTDGLHGGVEMARRATGKGIRQDVWFGEGQSDACIERRDGRMEGAH